MNPKDQLLMERLKKENPDFEYLAKLFQERHKESLTNITYDLKNMLTILSSAFQFTEHEHPEATTFKYWDEIKQNTKDMCAFLDQLNESPRYNL